MTSDLSAACCGHVVAGVLGAARLVDYLKERLAVVPITEIGRLITAGGVFIGGRAQCGRTFDRIADGDSLRLDATALAQLAASGRWNPPWEHGLAIAYEDDDLLVVDKPAGMPVHPLGAWRDGTLLNALVFHAGARPEQPWASWRPHLLQRLDHGVSGLLVVAKSAAVKATLVRAQKQHAIVRSYCALVTGRITAESGVIDAPLGREPGSGYRRAIVPLAAGGATAITRWRVLECYPDRTLVALQPETGRTHQLRVHLASLGHPIVGDDLYARRAPEAEPPWGGEARSRAIALHARHLRFEHPRSGKLLELESPLPQRFVLTSARA